MEGDTYYVHFQTLNKAWLHGYNDPNTKVFGDAVKFFTNELTKNIIGPALGNQILEFQVLSFKKGPGNNVIVKATMVVKQSHINNEITLKEAIRAKAITYYEEGQKPKTL